MNKLDMVAVVSSQIAARAYDEATHTMHIQFAPRKDGTPGAIYEYRGVDPDTWKAFVEAESVGSHFIKHIKPFPEKYPFVKLEQEVKASA